MARRVNGTRVDSPGLSGAAPALEVQGVSKRYRRKSWFRRTQDDEGRLALSNVSFAIRRGETLGLLGPNGAGKTTLLKIITTLLYPSEGRVLLDGHDVFGEGRRIRAQMGLVTCDERSFYWRLTGRQNLRFFATLYGLPARHAQRRIEELLETLGMQEAGDRAYQEYSSGMRQKLAIARGLLGDPLLVLYDEPTRSLDPLSALHVRDYIRNHRAEMPSQTHLIATNQLHEAEYLCDRVLIINGGRLIAFGTIDEVKRMWQQGDCEVHRVWWRGSPLRDRVWAELCPGILSVEDVSTGEENVHAMRLTVARDGDGLSEALRQVLRSGGSIVRCEAEEAAFDDVFCSLVRATSDAAAAPEPAAAAAPREGV